MMATDRLGTRETGCVLAAVHRSTSNVLDISNVTAPHTSRRLCPCVLGHLGVLRQAMEGRSLMAEAWPWFKSTLLNHALLLLSVPTPSLAW